MKETIQLFRDLQLPLNNTDFIGAFYQSIQTVSTKSKRVRTIPSRTSSRYRDPAWQYGIRSLLWQRWILLKVLNENIIRLKYMRDIDELALKYVELIYACFLMIPILNLISKGMILSLKKIAVLIIVWKIVLKNNLTTLLLIRQGSKFTQGQKISCLKISLLKTTESFSITSIILLKISSRRHFNFLLPYSF